MKNHHHYWFLRRRYGWGWVPVTWQGWTSVLAFVVAVLIATVVLVADEPKNQVTSDVVVYIVVVTALALMLLAVSFAKGPTPKWRWGSAADDNDSEDF